MNLSYTKIPSITTFHKGGKLDRASKTFRKHMEKRMRTFKKGQMHSHKRRTGPVVRKRSQAIAIALSEARKKGLKGAPQMVKGY